MPPSRDQRAAIRKDPAARAVIAAWRKLTGGAKVRDPDRRTLIACSGGADSSALAIILASATDNVVIGHIEHDLRPNPAAAKDRNLAEALAISLGADWRCRRARIKHLPGNAEANARRQRYRLLASIAARAKCPFIATGHQADDQAETLLMRLMTGAGPRGLRAVRPRRPLGDSRSLIRPMLSITREDAERICRLASHRWALDTTNADQTRLRSAVRHQLLPLIRAIAPGAALAMVRAAALQQDAATLIRRRARTLAHSATPSDSALRFSTQHLSRQLPAVLGDLLGLLHAHLAGDRRIRALSAAALDPVIEAIREPAPKRRTFTIGGITITTTPRETTVKPRNSRQF